MEKVGYEYLEQLAQNASISWSDFCKELNLAMERCEIDSSEMNELKDTYKLRLFTAPRLSTDSWFRDPIQCIGSSKKVVDAIKEDTDDCAGLHRALAQIRQFTGLDFQMYIDPRSFVWINLYFGDWSNGSVIEFKQEISDEGIITLCGPSFCDMFKISTLLAQDVWSSFLDSMEPLCQKAGFWKLHLRGHNLSDTRWAERRGYRKIGMHGRAEVWEKSFR